MIIFHEGLPRSGKSYECVVKQVIPAIKNGRKVFAYIEGLNHEKIAQLCDISIERCKELLIQIESEQVPDIHDFVEKDSLIIIDELQDYFPSGRAKLSDGITKLVTQHGHDGQDIICMGQNLFDCHNLWKRRVQRKIIFIKQDMIGRENSYKWEMFTGKPTNKDIKFVKISSGSEKYDPKYFGTYKSHTESTLNTGNLKDDRANIFKTKGFIFGIPALILIGIFAINYLISFFEPKEPNVQIKPIITRENIKRNMPITDNANDSEVNHANRRETREPPVIGRDHSLTYVEVLAEKYRIRLDGYINNDAKSNGLVSFYDDSFHKKEEFQLDELKALGWGLEYREYGLIISKDDTILVVRSWPMEVYGKVSNHTAALL